MTDDDLDFPETITDEVTVSVTPVNDTPTANDPILNDPIVTPGPIPITPPSTDSILDFQDPTGLPPNIAFNPLVEIELNALSLDNLQQLFGPYQFPGIGNFFPDNPEADLHQQLYFYLQQILRQQPITNAGTPDDILPWPEDGQLPDNFYQLFLLDPEANQDSNPSSNGEAPNSDTPPAS